MDETLFDLLRQFGVPAGLVIVVIFGAKFLPAMLGHLRLAGKETSDLHTSLSQAEAAFRTDLLGRVGALEAGLGDCERQHRDCERRYSELEGKVIRLQSMIGPRGGSSEPAD